MAIPADQRILHAIPQEYILDNSQEGIRNPVGMSACAWKCARTW